ALVPPSSTAISPAEAGRTECSDRKSTRLNSSHVKISYAVFCLKKKTREQPAKGRWVRLSRPELSLNPNSGHPSPIRRRSETFRYSFFLSTGAWTKSNLLPYTTLST